MKVERQSILFFLLLQAHIQDTLTTNIPKLCQLLTGKYTNVSFQSEEWSLFTRKWGATAQQSKHSGEFYQMPKVQSLKGSEMRCALTITTADVDISANHCETFVLRSAIFPAL